jgi:putative copper export protein
MLDPLAAILKALLYCALLSCVGAVIAAATLRTADLQQTAIRIARRGALLAIGVNVASLIVLLLRLGAFDTDTLSAVLSSGTGAALFMQIVGAILLLTWDEDPTAGSARVAFATLALVSFAFSGHASVVGPFEGIFAFVHVVAAAWWIGSLWLLRVACRNLDQPAIADVVTRFSALAVRVIAGLVITGSLLIYALVDFEKSPWITPYVENLIRKLVFVVAVLGLASYNRFRLTPRLLGGDTAAVATLRRSIDVELVIIAGVLIATAITTTYTSPHE